VLRQHVAAMDVDREVAGQIATVEALLPDLVAAAEDGVGGLD
jgi:hypothetical protein